MEKLDESEADENVEKQRKMARKATMEEEIAMVDEIERKKKMGMKGKSNGNESVKFIGKLRKKKWDWRKNFRDYREYLQIRICLKTPYFAIGAGGPNKFLCGIMAVGNRFNRYLFNLKYVSDGLKLSAKKVDYSFYVFSLVLDPHPPLNLG